MEKWKGHLEAETGILTVYNSAESTDMIVVGKDLDDNRRAQFREIALKVLGKDARVIFTKVPRDDVKSTVVVRTDVNELPENFTPFNARGKTGMDDTGRICIVMKTTSFGETASDHLMREKGDRILFEYLWDEAVNGRKRLAAKP